MQCDPRLAIILDVKRRLRLGRNADFISDCIRKDCGYLLYWARVCHQISPMSDMLCVRSIQVALMVLEILSGKIVKGSENSSRGTSQKELTEPIFLLRKRWSLSEKKLGMMVTTGTQSFTRNRSPTMSEQAFANASTATSDQAPSMSELLRIMDSLPAAVRSTGNMPVVENPMLTMTVTRVKRWRRRGRPGTMDKERVRTATVPDPTIYLIRPDSLMGLPSLPPYMVCHPAVAEALKKEDDDAPDRD